MKFIFLDIDGVIVPLTHKGDRLKWDSQKVDLVKTLLTGSETKIVISSSWRWEWSWNELIEIFEDNNISRAHLWGTTPIISMSGRSEEIKSWLNSQPESPFVILDDDEQAGEGMEDHFVKIDPRGGLQKEHIKKAFNILNE